MPALPAWGRLSCRWQMTWEGVNDICQTSNSGQHSSSVRFTSPSTIEENSSLGVLTNKSWYYVNWSVILKVSLFFRLVANAFCGQPLTALVLLDSQKTIDGISQTVSGKSRLTRLDNNYFHWERHSYPEEDTQIYRKPNLYTCFEHLIKE